MVVNIQTKACFKKELLAYIRTSRFIIISAVVVGLAVLSPLMVTGLAVLMDAMSGIYEEMGMDISTMTDMLGSYASVGVSMSVGDITGVGLIVFLIMLNAFAGGEQKRRSIIIPRSAGLSSFSYIFPKFVVYPLSALLVGFVSILASWGVSAIAFDVNDVSFDVALFAGLLTGVCMMLYVCFHLALGTATGKAGISATICIIAAFLLPNIFAFADMQYMFNPFTLELLAMDIISRGDMSASIIADSLITVLIALAIMMICYFLALFAQNARKIDNRGNEIEL